MSILLDARSVTKVFRQLHATHDVSLSVSSGDVVGLIGPNGAGKTTLLSLLAGLIAPTSGSIEYSPDLLACGALESSIGFASPEMPMFDYLTGAEVLQACGAVHSLRPGDTALRSSELFALFDMTSVRGRYVYEYSLGTRQKLSLCAALIHDPTILYLDEPFDGLDPTSAYRLVRLIGRLAAAGRALIVSSHDLSVVQRVCTRVVILKEGAVVHASAISPESPISPDPSTPRIGNSLEALMWNVVGEPEERRLSWIQKVD